ncbi:hypothetical protein F8M41_005205 [Gigaspora margarita]|uniref:Uncharacterized protein n=1 Tax=Gigaspora margarita TaxID=4874 RepID=A0A8H4AXG0_GIGMA|nr:hypothetical protein F8M41_005205 [Gigaspora margarita]
MAARIYNHLLRSVRGKTGQNRSTNFLHHMTLPNPAPRNRVPRPLRSHEKACPYEKMIEAPINELLQKEIIVSKRSGKRLRRMISDSEFGASTSFLVKYDVRYKSHKKKKRYLP